MSKISRFTFEDYSIMAHRTAKYPCLGTSAIYPSLSLAGEAGEVANLVKKAWRDHGAFEAHNIPHSGPDLHLKILLELGDVLWYTDAVARELNTSLGEVAQMNVEKLKGRYRIK